MQTILPKASAASVRHDGWTEARRQKFLDVLSRTANVTAAAAAVRKAKATAYALRQRDPDFAREWAQAITISMDELEAVAFERARNGTEKLIVRGGDTLCIREYSDRLLMFMLSRRKPEAYAELTGPRGDVVRERELCDEIETRLAAVEARRAAGRA